MISHYLCEYLLWNCQVSMELDLQATISTWNCDFKMCNIENFCSYNFLIGVLLLQFISKQRYFFFKKKLILKLKFFPDSLYILAHEKDCKGKKQTIMEDEATWKLKPSDLQLIFCVSRKYTKASFFCCVKFQYQLVFCHHFLKIKIFKKIPSCKWCDWYDVQ